MRRSTLARRAVAWLLLAGAACSGAALAQSTVAGRVPTPVIEKARGESCVAEPAFMRRNHMDLLKHQRDETVHRGVRDPRSSLKGCIECHASSATGSVAAAPTDFCASCHSYAAVKVDCFECHASKPKAAAVLPANHPAHARLAALWRSLPAVGAVAR
ncbi:MAG: hypothetical protein H6R06_3691 [Proteobacteria bacterium]|jgi:hypothetical protein|nr:hypothetical protein [Pseudomonadota bacterium]